ncbi:hypothetical protein HOD05_01350 [Candidatus Woesearchaeota archaeon]|jgi:hypothetical protein|nr:hypothetical protein [Candidatus Woesearchaeota archaeon]MBT4151051.1 hypothetical protein [Candidatus Woesearchaeota archaeon]MBT4247572.1 hypothetical protein [Candidatus Woesearchaeota archaeon]MBT4433841.1 hypothetical protein [Candidatus Woesearchaeota archaeon]MBT7332160.1 hypothetical protein [Candidatus Woesearchaeota archaeon]
MNKDFWIKFLYVTHIPVTIFWFALFVVPTSIWPYRMDFQFWYALWLVGGQVTWGVLMFRKLQSICPMTTVMQLLRGYDLKDKRNYEHGFIAEFFEDMRFPISRKGTSILLNVSFVIIVLQYFFLV